MRSGATIVDPKRLPAVKRALARIGTKVGGVKGGRRVVRAAKRLEKLAAAGKERAGAAAGRVSKFHGLDQWKKARNIQGSGSAVKAHQRKLRSRAKKVAAGYAGGGAIVAGGAIAKSRKNESILSSRDRAVLQEMILDALYDEE